MTYKAMKYCLSLHSMDQSFDLHSFLSSCFFFLFIALFLVYLESRLLWSGSSDRTIRVWEINTGRCIGVLNGASGGHVEAVSCLEFIPAAISAAAGIHKFTYLNGLL